MSTGCMLMFKILKSVFICVYVLPACVSVYRMHAVPSKARRGRWITWDWIVVSHIWVLGIEPFFKEEFWFHSKITKTQRCPIKFLPHTMLSTMNSLPYSMTSMMKVLHHSAFSTFQEPIVTSQGHRRPHLRSGSLGVICSPCEHDRVHTDIYPSS